MCTNNTKLLCICLFSLSVIASAPGQSPVRVTRFAEVQITLDENFTLANAQALPLARDSELKYSDDGQSVIVQISGQDARELKETGVEIKELRQFVLMEPVDNSLGTQQMDVSVEAQGGEPNAFRESDYDVNMPDDGSWIGSGINFDDLPSYIVTTVDTHYEIYPSYSGTILYTELTDSNFYDPYPMADGVSTGSSKFVDEYFGITYFAGEDVNQMWVLWAREEYGTGEGYIDYWWIKLYYVSPGGYCGASGGCDEYISRVEFDSINKSSGCDGYADYTSISNQMMPLDTEFITVTNGNPYSVDECGIWIDWNQDEDFDDLGETVSVIGSPGNGPYYAAITPSFSASIGDTRMRVRITYNQTPTPCGIDDFGEVEDYTITIGGPLRIGGHVLTSWGDPMPDINVAATTGESDFTDENGYYELLVQGPFQHCIRVTSELTYWTFDPYQYCLLETEDRFDIDFTGNYFGDPEPKMSGHVKTNEGYGIQGVLVEADPGDSTYTDSDGYYELTVSSGTPLPEPWFGTITPSKDHWFFSPPNWPVYGATVDTDGLDFTGSYTGPDSITVRGYITTSDGYGMSNTLVEASTGQSTYSGSGGFYELVVSVGDPFPLPWSGTVTPSLDYWDFDPVSRSFSSLSADIEDQNFVGTYTADPTPTITGYVKTAQGEPVKDVQIAADIPGGSAMTDANGFYQLMLFGDAIHVPRPYDGNVTPFKTDFSFDPPNNVYTGLAFDIADQNYIATYNGLGCDNGWLEEWVARYNGDDLDLFRDWINDMAIDRSGNIYVTGQSYNSQTEDDYILVKYDPNGRQLWAARYDEEKNESAEALAIDHLGNIYVTGKTETDDIYGNHYNCTTLRYSPDSNIPQWVAVYDGPDHESDAGIDIAIDPSGFIYVLCGSYNSTNSDIVTIKYSPDTNVPLWTTRYNGPDNNGDYPEAMVLDDNGNIYVTGKSRGNTTDDDYVTIKYSPDGNELWANRYNVPPDRSDEPDDLAVDNAGNVYVTGISIALSGVNADTVKYDSDGNRVWVASYTGDFDGVASTGSIALDKSGNIYVAGYVGTSTGDDYLLIKYQHDSNQPVWISKYDGTGNLDDWVWDIDLDKFDNVYVTGVSNFTPINPVTSADLMTLKYSPDNNEPLWSAVYSGPPKSLDFPGKVVVDNFGDVIVAGYNEAFVTIKYDQCCQIGDIDCDRSCNHKDLGYLCDEWLMQKIVFDIAPSGGDYYVDFFDWAAFAAAWRSQSGQPGFNSACDVIADGTIDEYDLIMFIEDWLKGGSPDLWADIYPQPDGDGVVNIYDFALFAQFWMTSP